MLEIKKNTFQKNVGILKSVIKKKNILEQASPQSS